LGKPHKDTVSEPARSLPLPVLTLHHVQTKLLRRMRNQGAATALAFLDEPQVLQRLRTRVSQITRDGSLVGRPRPNSFRLCRRPEPASCSATTDDSKASRFASQRCSSAAHINSDSRRRKIRIGFNWKPGLLIDRRGGCLPLRRSHKERHSLLEARPGAPSLLATQGHARHVAAREAIGEELAKHVVMVSAEAVLSSRGS
jgi:hypothetical protein